MDFLLVKLLSCVCEEFNNKLPLHMEYAAKIDKPNCDKVKPPFIIKHVNVFEV